MLRDWFRICLCVPLFFGACKGGEPSVTPSRPPGKPVVTDAPPIDSPSETFTLTVEGANSRFGEDMLFAEISSANEGREFIASAPGLNQVLVYSAETGALLQTLGGGTLQEIGSRLIDVGDVNGDNSADLLLTHQQGLVLALSGPDGLTLSISYTFPEGEQLGKIAALALVQPTAPGGPIQAVALRDHSTPAEPSSELSIFRVSAQSLTKQSSLMINTDGSGVYRLESGEWTGEGLPEIALGMPSANKEKGAVRVYSLTRQASGIGLVELMTLTGSVDGDRLGYAMDFGRVSNDELDDLIFSAPWSNNGLGAVWTLYGGSPVPPSSSVEALTASQTGTADLPLSGLALAAPKSNGGSLGSVHAMSQSKNGSFSVYVIGKLTPCDGCSQDEFAACGCEKALNLACQTKCCCTTPIAIKIRTIPADPDPEDDTKLPKVDPIQPPRHAMRYLEEKEMQGPKIVVSQ